MTENPNVSVNSEIGELKKVIIHRPGPEIENMTPENAERALYSDILNLKVATEEFNQFHGTLKNVCEVYEVQDLLKEVLKDSKVKHQLLSNIWSNENVHSLELDNIFNLEAEELVKQLFEGVILQNKTLTEFFSKERYLLRPLHNFFFTRDASMTIGNQVLIGEMANKVRDREALIMEAIFTNHPLFKTGVVVPPAISKRQEKITIEGGDVLVAREDVLLIGAGARTTAAGIDFITEKFGSNKEEGIKHIIVQELPKSPESFIHLDMIFTLLDKDKCMVYEPIIIKNNKLQTVHITIEDGDVKSIKEERSLIDSLNNLGFDLSPILCGGKEEWNQKREQWHSGANFFALGPGKVIGYGRNVNTIEQLDKAGFSVIPASDVVEKRVDLNDYNRYVVTIDGSELSRGGGGCRCMTMPVQRSNLS